MRLEINGTNVIGEGERHGKPRDLFWPWCGANVSLLALSYGAFVLAFGINFWQAIIAAFVGTIASFFLVGFSSLAGKRSNAPTTVLSRSVFGVKGNIIPGSLSYLLFVGWETVLISLATLATGTVFQRIGGLSRDLAMGAGFATAVCFTVLGGVLGFHFIMRLQRWITVATVVMTLMYFAMTFDVISWQRLTAAKPGSFIALIGATIFCIAGIGLGWANSAADYARYLPRDASSAGVVGWTVFGSSIVPIVMVVYGAALSGSDEELAQAIGQDPIGAFTTLLPTWSLVLFALIAVIGLVGGALMDLYSSGLTLISIGVPVKRHVAASFDSAIMIIGTIYIVWISDDFFLPFQGFLITLGVPIAAWTAIFVTDVFLRRKDYEESDLYRPEGRYGSWNYRALSVLVISTVIGWGFVTNTFASWLSWQGYLLFLIGGREGQWAYTNVGVVIALLVAGASYLLLCAQSVRRQESD